MNPLVLEQIAPSFGPARESFDCESTLSVDDAARIDWDAVVIGAGPAGALTARQLALLGLRTLLVDRSAFPRQKVCGGCISGLGRRLLASVGLESLLDAPSAAELSQFDLAAGGRRVSFELPAGAAVSRLHFDAQLVQEAIRAGAAFLSETTTIVRGLAADCRFRSMLLKHNDHLVRARARVVIAADGLGRTSLRQHRAFAAEVAPTSRIGLGATLQDSDAPLEPGSVLMSVGRDGYVGMVRIPGDTLNVAAAIDPNFVRRSGPAEAVRAVLMHAGVKAPAGLDGVEWRGTGLLTRHSRRIAARRLLVLGDAAGYVEPFTGEGMTWGMLAAVIGAPLVADWLSRDACATGDRFATRDEFKRLESAWRALYRTHIASRQRDCRALSSLLRHPMAVRTAMALIALGPNIVKPLIGHFWNSGNGVEIEPTICLPSREALR